MREIVTCQLARGWERVQLYTFTFKIVKSVLPANCELFGGRERSCRILLIGDKRLTSVRQFFFFLETYHGRESGNNEIHAWRNIYFRVSTRPPTNPDLYENPFIPRAFCCTPRIVWDLARSAVFKTGFIPLKNRKTRSIVPPFSRTWFRECSLPDRASLHLQPPNCSSLLETTTTCIYLNFLPFCLVWSGRNVAIRPSIISFVAGKNNSGTRSEYQIYPLRSFQKRIYHQLDPIFSIRRRVWIWRAVTNRDIYSRALILSDYSERANNNNRLIRADPDTGRFAAVRASPLYGYTVPKMRRPSIRFYLEHRAKWKFASVRPCRFECCWVTRVRYFSN